MVRTIGTAALASLSDGQACAICFNHPPSAAPALRQAGTCQQQARRYAATTGVLLLSNGCKPRGQLLFSSKIVLLHPGLPSDSRAFFVLAGFALGSRAIFRLFCAPAQNPGQHRRAAGSSRAGFVPAVSMRVLGFTPRSFSAISGCSGPGQSRPGCAFATPTGRPSVRWLAVMTFPQLPGRWLPDTAPTCPAPTVAAFATVAAFSFALAASGGLLLALWLSWGRCHCPPAPLDAAPRLWPFQWANRRQCRCSGGRLPPVQARFKHVGFTARGRHAQRQGRGWCPIGKPGFASRAGESVNPPAVSLTRFVACSWCPLPKSVGNL